MNEWLQELEKGLLNKRKFKHEESLHVEHEDIRVVNNISEYPRFFFKKLHDYEHDLLINPKKIIQDCSNKSMNGNIVKYERFA